MLLLLGPYLEKDNSTAAAALAVALAQYRLGCTIRLWQTRTRACPTRARPAQLTATTSSARPLPREDSHQPQHTRNLALFPQDRRAHLWPRARSRSSRLARASEYCSTRSRNPASAPSSVALPGIPRSPAAVRPVARRTTCRGVSTACNGGPAPFAIAAYKTPPRLSRSCEAFVPHTTSCHSHLGILHSAKRTQHARHPRGPVRRHRCRTGRQDVHPGLPQRDNITNSSSSVKGLSPSKLLCQQRLMRAVHRPAQRVEREPRITIDHPAGTLPRNISSIFHFPLIRLLSMPHVDLSQ